MPPEKTTKEHIDKKLLTRIRMFAIILFLMTGALVYEVFVSDIRVWWVLLGLILGVTIGFLAGRMFSIEWHREKKQVIGRLDRVGIIVLVLYIAFSVARHWIFEQWFAGAILSAFTFSFIEGAMLGRILSLGSNIKRVLVEQGKI